MNEILERISMTGVVPVIRIDDKEKAVPLAQALIEGGLPCAEITFRTDQAEEALFRITKALPEMLVGAGTVITCEQVDKAVAAGAKFIVSPGLNPKVVKHCLDLGVPVTPGVCTPSEIERAMELGLDTVKFFPAEQSGGIAFIKAISAPYGSVKFIPTGGINAKNILDYLSFSNVLACGGSWMVKPELVAACDFAAITALTRETVRTMLGFELAHIGINRANEREALFAAEALGRMFDFPVKNGNSSVYAGTSMEFTKEPYHGKNGHIAVSTHFVERAMAYLKLKGVRFDETTVKKDVKGIIAIYIAEEIAGFAFHLLRK